MSEGRTSSSASQRETGGAVTASSAHPPTPGEIRAVLADLLTLADNARDAAGEPFNGGGRFAPHFAIRAGHALLPRLAR
jgi:hypothetical protein